MAQRIHTDASYPEYVTSQKFEYYDSIFLRYDTCMHLGQIYTLKDIMQ